MALRHCPTCGALRRADCCAACGWVHSRFRPRRRRDLGTNQWKNRSRTRRELHVDQHGLVCLGYPPTGHHPHNVDDISDLALHEIDGPGSHPDRCVVLCREENGRIGAPT